MSQTAIHKCPLPLTILMGVNDSFYLGGGWHAGTMDERYGLPYRPTAEQAELRLPELAEGGGGELAILVASSPPMLGRPVQAQVRLDGRLMGEMEFKTDLWRVWRLPLKPVMGFSPASGALQSDVAASSDGRHILEFRVAEPFVPDTLLKNGDHRVMGLFISAIRWTQGTAGK